MDGAHKFFFASVMLAAYDGGLSVKDVRRLSCLPRFMKITTDDIVSKY